MLSEQKMTEEQLRAGSEEKKSVSRHLVYQAANKVAKKPREAQTACS